MAAFVVPEKCSLKIKNKISNVKTDRETYLFSVLWRKRRRCFKHKRFTKILLQKRL